MKYEDGLKRFVLKSSIEPYLDDNTNWDDIELVQAYKQGYKHALGEAINIIFAFGPDEMDKKMRVRDLLNSIK